METLKLVLVKALKDIYPDRKCVINHTINHYFFGEIDFHEGLTGEQLKNIKNRMQELIDSKTEIVEKKYTYEELRSKAEELGRKAVAKLLNNSLVANVFVYEMDGYEEFFYEKIYTDVSILKDFDLVKYRDGFLLKVANLKYSNDRKFSDKPKLVEVFKNTRIWNKIMDVDYIGSLNEKIINNEIRMLIRINEVLHNNRIAEIAHKIKNTENIKLITIAGPSSSGKTTFSNKLYLSLRAFEIEPVVISLDNYYIGRSKIPVDENGQKDFETIKALDIELLNQNLIDLIEKGEAEIPIYNFISGERESFTKKVSLNKNGLIIIEGIHGLNEELTYRIPKEVKFKIYVSCLSQINIDSHNRVATTDVRKIRRLVRDGLSRNASVEETLGMWESVRGGEEKYIFPYQEDADIMFNSSLVYELSVLKNIAIKELLKVKSDSPNYQESRRLINLLNCFLAVDDDLVPDDSLLKEFIGKSLFYNY